MARVKNFVASIVQTRVIFPNRVEKSTQLSLVLGSYKFNNPDRFRMHLRVIPPTFDALVVALEDHPIFWNNSNSQQFPVPVQLAVALYRFGHYGNAASVASVAQWAGISDGAVVDCTRRVCVAVLALHDDVIRWSTPPEKEEAKHWVEKESCAAWRGGFCMVDGTTIPLFQKPGFHGEAYFDRKSRYSLNAQVCFHCADEVLD